MSKKYRHAELDSASTLYTVHRFRNEFGMTLRNELFGQPLLSSGYDSFSALFIIYFFFFLHVLLQQPQSHPQLQPPFFLFFIRTITAATIIARTIAPISKSTILIPNIMKHLTLLKEA